MGVISVLPDLRDHHVDDEDTAELGLGAHLALVLTPVPLLHCGDPETQIFTKAGLTG